MYSYQPLKADEVQYVLGRLDERLADCPRGERDPVFILKCLEERLADIAKEYEDDEAVFRDPDFGLDGLNRLGAILSSLSLIEDAYMPAVVHQTEEERTLRTIFIKSADRLGLEWIQDLVVYSSGSLAIFPSFLGSYGIPVIHVQVNFLDKCLSLPGVFHELGHSVFLKFLEILTAMQKEVTEHFDSMRKGIGPVKETVKDKQIERLNEAQQYWDEDRLAELFCDVFAQYVSGCANIVSMIDLSMAEGQPACKTDVEGYPPDAARVKVCEYASTDEQLASVPVKDLLKNWEDYADIDNAPSFYRDVCHDKLLRRLSACIVKLISTLMPNTPKSVSVLPTFEEATAPFDTLTFEEAAQRAIAIQVFKPAMFDSWWREAQKKLI